jgi:hypothetical protein
VISLLWNLQNEEDIAAALKEHGISREDVFITSKVSPYEQGTEKATLACQQILQRLQTDYVVSAEPQFSLGPIASMDATLDSKYLPPVTRRLKTRKGSCVALAVPAVLCNYVH